MVERVVIFRTRAGPRKPAYVVMGFGLGPGWAYVVWPNIGHVLALIGFSTLLGLFRYEHT